MEKILSPEERIRKAEEIYYRRRQNNRDVRVSSNTVNSRQEGGQLSLYRKMILQILICIVIYVIFYLIKNTNYLFSQDVINQTQSFLKTDINFEQITKQITEFWENNSKHFEFLGTWFHQENVENSEELNDNKEQKNEENNVESNQVENQEQSNHENEENKANNNSETNSAKQEEVNNEINNSKQEENKNEIANEEVGIGGASSNEIAVETSSQDNSKKTQMEIDAEYITKTFHMQLPVKGPITSHYGKREATEIVSANHQGIDIGVETGTTIVASMEGTVSLVSDEGEYGTHIKIVNKDITTIYAHCSKILVKEGAKIKKGQKIALSGNTGKTTGPHLHFEIRRNERTINPELILSWT